MGGVGGIFLIIVLVGTLIIAGAQSFGVKKSQDFYKPPDLLSWLSLPVPPSGGLSYSTSKTEQSITIPQTASTMAGGLDPNVTPPDGFSRDQLSSYYGKVRLGSFSPSYSYYSRGYFSLNVNSNANGQVAVSGWRLKSNRGTEFPVPNGISDYDPWGIAKDSPIILNSGDHLNVYTTSPAFIHNVRLNKCMGYLNNHMNSNPSFPKNCPSEMRRGEFLTLPGQCQNFLNSLGTCYEPTAADFNIPGVAPDCVKRAQDRVGYGACYQKHRNDSDFFSETWYAWLSDLSGFDTTHDRVLLLDQSGKLVDVYIY